MDRYIQAVAVNDDNYTTKTTTKTGRMCDFGPLLIDASDCILRPQRERNNKEKETRRKTWTAGFRHRWREVEATAQNILVTAARTDAVVEGDRNIFPLRNSSLKGTDLRCPMYICFDQIRLGSRQKSRASPVLIMGPQVPQPVFSRGGG